ncbi:Eukaryotic translation initiation factor SUI1 protein [Dioscorea alata]|uniref:Eukaryotic translation initiation factor SUI1 protein n=1 Tax=Dioscorea alata TaxID=55571 RepID=A0ACB7VNI1_DIOAL|nr:Eukaryotic translation initiation factor SUI1 protein [Dioscorea alata]
MSELDAQIPSAFDPFAEANADDSGAGSKEYVHVRIQQRNGRKSLTTVQGLKKEFSYSKILKDLKREFCCNGTVVQDPELGQVIQLQGDQRKNVSNFLIQVPHSLPICKFVTDEQRLLLLTFITGKPFFFTFLAVQAGIVKKESIKIHGF